MDTPFLFGEWLRQRRKALDLTRDELAARAGCSVFALRKIESGERKPSKQLAGLLANALELPEEIKPIFIRVARGELNVKHLQAPTPDSGLAYLPHPKPAPHHLPLPPTSLLGRDAELSALERLFKDSQCRLLTLTGMGGIGKTRLGIEFASRQRDRFADGVHFVPLASINSADSIVPAIAEALEFSFSGPADLKEQLLKYMSVSMKRSALLVLDNLEHLITQSSETVELVSELLQRIPQLKILATSRERLNLQGEWMYELHGLPIPPVELTNKLDSNSATALFMQRALHLKPDFQLIESERLELVRICQLVEGVPLAIELAAAWVGMLTCSEIAREIESNMDFLSVSMRDMPERHRSLKATFDHSWKLLTDPERDALSRLSVFRGGFDRSAAEKVAVATLPLLASLVSKSLVRRTAVGRYDLHEVIRQYASSHLNEHQLACFDAYDHHCEYYLRFVADREKDLKGSAQQAAIRELTREMDNIRVAWAWAVRQKQFGLLGISVRSLGWTFEVSGLLREGIEQLELLAQLLKAESHNGQWNRILGLTLMQQALLCFRKGQFDQAQGLYKESITILRPIGDQSLLADTLIFLGTITHLNGDYEQSKSLLEEGLACAQAVNDRWFTAYGIYNLGYFDSLMGDYQKGYEQMLIGLDMWRSVGDLNYIALGLNFRVPTQIELGRYDEAKESMHESISLCERSKNRWGMGTAYRYLGLAMMADGQYTEALDCFQKSLEIFGDYFEGWDIALSLAYLAEATALLGNETEAKMIYHDALRHAHQIQSVPLMLMTLTGLAQLESRIDPDRAVGWLTVILAHPAAPQATKDRAAQIKQEAECHLVHKATHAIEMGISSQIFEDLVNTIIAK